MYDLSEGSLEQIMRGVDVDKPVFQILGYKRLLRNSNKDDHETDRYRLLISDGQKLNSFTMLATQLNHLITDDVLNEYAIFRITNYRLSSVNNRGKEKRVMLILGIDVLASGSEVGYKIGNPTNIENNVESEIASTSI